ncbi:hypothetical protein Misp01_26570 [Microtetraspora sp. NBRC 13810]|nr:hypothetical protein Misp01_26570 [Microtetraspora sp. NBRC 13810]
MRRLIRPCLRSRYVAPTPGHRSANRLLPARASPFGLLGPTGITPRHTTPRALRPIGSQHRNGIGLTLPVPSTGQTAINRPPRDSRPPLPVHGLLRTGIRILLRRPGKRIAVHDPVRTGRPPLLGHRPLRTTRPVLARVSGTGCRPVLRRGKRIAVRGPVRIGGPTLLRARPLRTVRPVLARVSGGGCRPVHGPLWRGKRVAVRGPVRIGGSNLVRRLRRRWGFLLAEAGLDSCPRRGGRFADGLVRLAAAARCRLAWRGLAVRGARGLGMVRAA